MAHYRTMVDLFTEGELDDPKDFFSQALYYGDRHQDFWLQVNESVTEIIERDCD